MSSKKETRGFLGNDQRISEEVLCGPGGKLPRERGRPLAEVKLLLRRFWELLGMSATVREAPGKSPGILFG